jgi:hypothetical protein
MNEIGLAIQCNTCQTAGVLGPFGSDMAVSYYELAVLVTYLLNDVEKRRDQRKANARLNTLSPKTVVSQVERVCFLRNSDTLSLGCRAFTEIQRALLRSGTTRLWRV